MRNDDDDDDDDDSYGVSATKYLDYNIVRPT